MAARIRYSTADGNTVPYPPLFDDIRRNHGFVDTRGRPDQIAEIPEARESIGLTTLLRTLAAPDAQLISLGCDLGQHEETKSRIEMRRVAGGYVQVVCAGSLEPTDEINFLRSVGKAIEHELKARAGSDRWEVNLQLSPVFLKFGDEMELQSIWIWFYAKASTFDRALASRERLLQALDSIIVSLPRPSAI